MEVLLADEMTAIDEIDAAFGALEKPEHFTNYTHCDECEEHDLLLRRCDRTTITIYDVGNPGWDPIAFGSPIGMAYYMPALARFALSAPTREFGWYGDQLIFHLTCDNASNRFLSFCNTTQRDAIVSLLTEMQRFGKTLAETLTDPEEFTQAIDLWRA